MASFLFHLKGTNSFCKKNFGENTRPLFEGGASQGTLATSWSLPQYRGTSLIRKPPFVGPYSNPMPRDLW